MIRRNISGEQIWLAIKLRRRGYSYSEIRKKVPIAKSSLSLIFKGIKLSKKTVEILAHKNTKGQKIAAKAKHIKRLKKERRIRETAMSEIKDISDRELFLMGLMLYWGEGAKIREGNISQQVAFGNSDPKMCRLFLFWLMKSLKIKIDEIYFSVYINSVYRGKESEVTDFWAKYIGVPNDKFKKVSLTNTNTSMLGRHNPNPNYHGLLRIRVKRSVDLNRKIEGWIEGVYLKSGLASLNKV